MFSINPKKNFCFQVTFILSSANALSLDQSKNLPFGRGLKDQLPLYQTTNFWSKLKALADDKMNVTEKMKFILVRVGNIMGKLENADYSIFSFFHVFKRPFCQGR